MADSNEEKKDLTGIIQYADHLKKSGEAPPVPTGVSMEEIPIEKIDDFESLEQYAAANPHLQQHSPPPSNETELPTSESSADTGSSAAFPTDPFPEATAQPGSATDPVAENLPGLDVDGVSGLTDPAELSGLDGQPPGLESLSGQPPGLDSSGGFAELPSLAPDGLGEPAGLAHLDGPVSPLNESPNETSAVNSDFPISNDPAGLPQNDVSQGGAEFSASEFPIGDSSSSPGFDFEQTAPSQEPVISSPERGAPPAAGQRAFPRESQPSTPSPHTSVPLASSQTQSSPLFSSNKPESTLTQVRKFSEELPSKNAAVSASFPFSLYISGHLTPREKEKLLDIISNENLGIREIDLEPQLAAGKILLPQISEYAGIVIVQALRETRAELRFGPAESAFADDTPLQQSSLLASQASGVQTGGATSRPSRSGGGAAIIHEEDEISHPAENLPILTLSDLSGTPYAGQSYLPIDTITATASLRVQVVEAEKSSEYQEILEALQREVRYKAFRRGADAVIHFRVQLEHLSSPTHYRILAIGTAVRFSNPGPDQKAEAPSADISN